MGDDGSEDSDSSSSVGWAVLFDLISSEYGWTDEEILDLTMTRIRHVVDAIGKRRRREFEARAMLAQAQAQVIVGAMPGLAQSKKAAASIAKYAAKIRLVAPKVKELPSTESVVALFSQKRR